MKILVTGSAGFIGFFVSRALVEQGHKVVGLDNINDYYDPQLKYARLAQLGIVEAEASKFLRKSTGTLYGDQFTFIRMHLEDRQSLPRLFEEENFEVVCNLAAQAGVRYSLQHPESYIDSNIVGFLNILECCRHHGVSHLVYASSSSVYGLNREIPFRVEQQVDHPISLYAVSKKSNELMAHTYSHLFGFATTGLRFFTVYGPWGRPDMAMFLFTDAILRDKPIKVFNHGKMERDFTYIDDIVKGVLKVIESDPTPRREQGELYKLYNIGSNRPVKLMDFIEEIETNTGKKAKLEMLPIQPGDVEKTWANVDQLIKDYHYSPGTDLKEGVKSFISWYRKYYGF